MDESRKKDRSIPPARVALLPLNTEDTDAISAELQKLSDGYLPTGPNGQSRFKLGAATDWELAVNPLIGGLAYTFSTHRIYDKATAQEIHKNVVHDSNRVAIQSFGVTTLNAPNEQMLNLSSGEFPEPHKSYIAQRLNQMNFTGLSIYRDAVIRFYFGREMASRKFGLTNNPKQTFEATYDAENPNTTKIKIKNSGAIDMLKFETNEYRVDERGAPIPVQPQFQNNFIVECDLNIDLNLPPHEQNSVLFPIIATPRIRFEIIPDDPKAKKDERRAAKIARKEAKTLIKKATRFHKRILELKSFPSDTDVNQFIQTLGQPHNLGLNITQDTMLTDWVFSKYSPNQNYFETAITFTTQHPSSNIALLLRLATFTLTIENNLTTDLANSKDFSIARENLQNLKAAVADSQFKGNKTIILRELKRIENELNTIEATVTADITSARLQAELTKIDLSVLKEIGNYVANELHTKNITDLYTEFSNPELVARNNKEIALMVKNGLKDPELRPLIGNLFIAKVLRLNDVLPELALTEKTQLLSSVFKQLSEPPNTDYSCLPPVVRDATVAPLYASALVQLSEKDQKDLFFGLLKDRPRDAFALFGTYALENPDIFEQQLTTQVLTQLFTESPKETFAYDFAKVAQNNKPSRFAAKKDKTRYETAHMLTEIYEIIDALKNGKDNVTIDQAFQRIPHLSHKAREFLVDNSVFLKWLTTSHYRSRTIQALTENLNLRGRYDLLDKIKRKIRSIEVEASLKEKSNELEAFAEKHIITTILKSTVFKGFIENTSSYLIDNNTSDVLKEVISWDKTGQGLNKLIEGATKPQEKPYFWERWFPGKIRRENDRIKRQGQILQATINFMASKGSPEAFSKLTQDNRQKLTAFVDMLVDTQQAKPQAAMKNFIGTIERKIAEAAVAQPAVAAPIAQLPDKPTTGTFTVATKALQQAAAAQPAVHHERRKSAELLALDEDIAGHSNRFPVTPESSNAKRSGSRLNRQGEAHATRNLTSEFDEEASKEVGKKLIQQQAAHEQTGLSH